ncbi:MAG TPA: YihY/virulence factor BrkB family protein [Solirubrobacteraceae bacterium]|nr:YihY/virulence factor BrkB family protein [Solirubrobacteraceae bacterium]
MSTAAAVPCTRHELEGDEALETLRRCGRRRLIVDAITRFRAADGFSHSRALAFQATLTLLPALIALVGFASALDQDQSDLRRILQETIEAIAPGAIGALLTDALRQGSSTASGEAVLVAGLVAAVLAGTSAMAQVERGANRIYGVEQDRPFVRRYLAALGLALTAGVLALLALTALVAGAAIRDAAGGADGFDTAWAIARWPIGLACMVGAIALLFEIAPHRRQPEPSWLAFGSGAAAALWVVFMGILVAYIEATGTFGATYGPLAGTIGVLLWTFGSSCALFGGLALSAQLEAVRAGVPGPRLDRPVNTPAGE